MTLTNLMPKKMVGEIDTQLRGIMPILFLLFFTVAGSNLHIAALPSLGMLGLVYIIGRTAGLMGGARLGATIGKAVNAGNMGSERSRLCQSFVLFQFAEAVAEILQVFGQGGRFLLQTGDHPRSVTEITAVHAGRIQLELKQCV